MLFLLSKIIKRHKILFVPHQRLLPSHSVSWKNWVTSHRVSPRKYSQMKPYVPRLPAHVRKIYCVCLKAVTNCLLRYSEEDFWEILPQGTGSVWITQPMVLLCCCVRLCQEAHATPSLYWLCHVNCIANDIDVTLSKKACVLFPFSSSSAQAPLNVK